MTCQYSMVIQWSDEDQAYIVTLPEFGGNKTHGDTYAKAAKMGQEALESLIETYESRELAVARAGQVRLSGGGWLNRGAGHGNALIVGVGAWDDCFSESTTPFSSAIGALLLFPTSFLTRACAEEIWWSCVGQTSPESRPGSRELR